MIEGLGPAFLGTSNCLIAMRREVEAIGTNAHELPMVYCALAGNDRELAEAPYTVLADWQEDYDGNLRVMLPDTYGSRRFPGPGAGLGDELDRHAHQLGRPHRGRRDRHRLVAAPRARTRARSCSSSPTGSTWTRSSASIGTSTAACASATAGARCSPTTSAVWAPTAGLDPFSIVCKVISADGRPTVKLSDNPMKAMGPPAEVARYRRVFEVGEQVSLPVAV